jgi:thioesterase domain-containing protein
LHLVVGDELAAGEHDVVYGQSFVDYVARWAELAAGGVETHRVGGTHFSVLRAPNVGGLAELLTGLLDGDRDGTGKGGRP